MNTDSELLFLRLHPLHISNDKNDGLEWANPHLYVAHYFGHKLHVDQNQKLAMFGITYILARHGYSGKIVGSSVMPTKNNFIIYEEVYRQTTLEYGLFDELCADHWCEFYLMLYVHEKLRERCGPHLPAILSTLVYYASYSLNIRTGTIRRSCRPLSSSTLCTLKGMFRPYR